MWQWLRTNLKESLYSWKFITRTQAELHEAGLYDSAVNCSETVRVIAERVVNEQLSEEVKRRYAEAVAEGRISFEYSPPSPVDTTDFLKAKFVELYDDDCVRSLSQTEGNVRLYQEWHKSGLPKLALIENTFEASIEKRVWTEAGKPEYLVNFLKGKLHGIVCKWNGIDRITYAARFENGIESFRLSESDVPIELFEPVLERPPKGTKRGGGIKISFSMGRPSNSNAEPSLVSPQTSPES